MQNSLMDSIESLLIALQVKQSKYKYDFIIEISFNQKVKSNFRKYSIIKFHTEVIDGKRYKIRDSQKAGKLVEILNYLTQELESFKAVDSTWMKATSQM